MKYRPRQQSQRNERRVGAKRALASWHGVCDRILRWGGVGWGIFSVRNNGASRPAAFVQSCFFVPEVLSRLANRGGAFWNVSEGLGVMRPPRSLKPCLGS